MKEFKNGDAIFQITKEYDADVMQNFKDNTNWRV